MNWILALLGGYALGSVPFGLILTRIAGAGDLRAIGSGNIGATNVLRTGRKGLAAATLLLDLLKGLAAVLIAARWLPGTEVVAAIAAFLGHCFPVWLRFRGGKGVATTAGICFGLAWPVGLVYAVTWLALLGVTRISSLAGMTAAIAAPIAAFSLGHRAAAGGLLVIALVVLFQHRANIARLRAGTEPRIGGGKS
ncbi:glycerol-3-phosphate 1-O-acyltransferase PlsY [Novosphingobium album (ex Liu et al. 2023)]|uniref:Glycerol-3-phosphate acyltransferase n=1 Tax=Novosphingobium album (ex Liu et al. 2023) TaxID=3031130 RepID=A0ABT5WWW9_9SPHN|nr:glycerol-3-phosphate 1-O-acyltransferase PlsY [Novosphingobium album (ex Liu et al. 2023)]MDE8654388.1 glycerol-3-phosphate 1-O-acyltransferase PlsY [Novosphingobium album (ex Liu et al. 2023)]